MKFLTDGYCIGTSDFFNKYPKDLNQYEMVRGKFLRIFNNAFSTKYFLKGDNDAEFDFEFRNSVGDLVKGIFGVAGGKSLEGQICQIYSKDEVLEGVTSI
jgi:hypothetical protein